MSKGLSTLLRLNGNRTEAGRIALARAVEAREAAAAELDRHAEAVGRETPPTDAPARDLLDWTLWQARARETERGLRLGLAALSRQEAESREALRDCVAEGKRFELALAARLRTQRRAAERRREAAAEEAARARAGTPPTGSGPAAG